MFKNGTVALLAHTYRRVQLLLGNGQSILGAIIAIHSTTVSTNRWEHSMYLLNIIIFHKTQSLRILMYKGKCLRIKHASIVYLVYYKMFIILYQRN